MEWNMDSSSCSPTAPRRRWFRFSLRTLFLVVAILGVFHGWLGVQLKWMYDRHEALQWALDHKEPVVISLEPPEVELPWQLTLLGERPQRTTFYFAPCTDEQLAQIERVRKLFPEANVQYGNAPWRSPTFVPRK